MSTERNVPKLRFPGFTEPWEQRKLDDVLEVLKDGTHGTHADVDNGVYLLSAKNIKNGCVSIDESDRQISFEEYEKIHTKFKLKNGDVLMTIVGTIGEAAILESAENITFQRSVAFLRPSNELQNSFLLQTIYTKSFQKELDNRKATGAQPGIYLGEVAQIPIMIPTNLSEQEKISSYFDNLDNLITLHQRKLKHVKDLKKSMLQKMFPKNGQEYPELRFPGFTEPWEQRKLSEISDVRDGTHDSPSYISEGHPFVTSKNVKDGYINYDEIQYISDEDFESINKRSKVDVNDILMGMIGTIGNLALIRTEPDFAIKNVALIKDTKQVSYMYLYHYLQSPSTERQLLSGLDGGTQKFVSLKNIRELNILVPSEEEQIKVGTFIESIDNLITLHQRELKHLKLLKKGMLQQILI